MYTGVSLDAGSKVLFSMGLHLRHVASDVVELTFQHIIELDGELPGSARKYREWYSNEPEGGATSKLMRGWLRGLRLSRGRSGARACRVRQTERVMAEIPRRRQGELIRGGFKILLDHPEGLRVSEFLQWFKGLCYLPRLSRSVAGMSPPKDPMPGTAS